MREMGAAPPESERQLREEQETLDRLAAEFFDVFRDSPLQRWGLVPADIHLPTLVTYQFLHSGWLHLLGNLFIFFLAGPFIEDVWGRPLFAAFYVTAGAFSGIMFAVRYPDFGGPLIGASGAIAGVMGAFLIRYWHTKIKFFYWFFPFMGTFEAAAWIMLPLWFLKELFFAQAMDVAVGGAGGGVAFWAHVWGFVYGVVTAVAISYFKIETRFIHPTIESKVTVVENTGVEKAMELAAGGDLSGGVQALVNELRLRPENVDAAMAMWSLCQRQGNPEPAAPHMVRAIRAAARDGDDDFVLAHWDEVFRAVENLSIPAGLAVRIAEISAAANRVDTALDTLELARGSLDGTTPAGVLVRSARLAASLGSPHAGGLIDAALAHPDVPEEARTELGDLRNQVAPSASTGGEIPVETEADVEEEGPLEVKVPSRAHKAHVMRAIPRSLDGNDLKIEVDGALRRMGLGQVQALGVGGVAREGRKPVVVVDLLLDSPWGDRETLRIVRLTSDSFDPRGLVGGDDAMAAFRTLLDHLLKVSEAVPLPDPDAARGRPFRSFPSFEAYHREVLGVEEHSS
jgi:membrane associated rhomboid family serine protease